MRVLVVCEYIHAKRWLDSAWAIDISRGLRARGHDIVVACDGADDPDMLAPAEVLRRDDPRRAEHRKPMAFARWARTLVRRGSQDVSLSLSPLVGADVWCPVERSAAGYLAELLRRRNPASFFMGLTHSEWLPGAWWAERRAKRRGIYAPIGVEPAQGGLGYASAYEPPPDRDEIRRRAREVIGVSPNRHVLVMTGVHHANPGLPDMLAGLAALEESAPLLLVLGREGFSVHARARNEGCEHLVRLLGGSRRMDAAILAADAAVAPLARSDASTGRFIADCLRLGVPVLADARAPGAELLHPRTFGSAPVGLIVESSGWAEAIERILTPEWLDPSRHAAAGVGVVLSMEGLLTRLEHILKRARPDAPPPRPKGTSKGSHG